MSNKILKIIITLLLLSTLLSAEPLLQLDTGGHTGGGITDIITTKSDDIISASADKTIRVWDGKTGREKRKILGQIGAGSEGKIFAIALSPDEEYLAVGGIIGDSSNKSWGNIRIYHYPTGKLIKLLKSHTHTVKDLAFSEDGRYLISCSGDTTAKIWDISDNFSLIDTITVHDEGVHAVRIITKRGRPFAVTAGYDNQIALYDMEKRKTVKRVKLNYRLHYMATAANLFGGRIAVCGYSKEILIYDYNLKLIKKVKSKMIPAGLSYSADGKLLIAGVDGIPSNVNIYRSKKNYSKKTSFKKHTNLTTAVAFLNKNTAVSGGGSNSEIYLWDTQSARVKKKIVGVGRSVWSVGIRGDEIAWGNIPLQQINQHTKLQKSINLNSFNIRTKINRNSFKRISTKKGSYTLSHKAGGEYGYPYAVLVLKKNGKEITSITRGSANGLGNYCYGFYKDMIVSGGGNGNLEFYNFQGKKVADLIGHTGAVWSIAIDGNRLVSGSLDQTMRIWDLSGLNPDASSPVTIRPLLNLFVAKNNEWVAWANSGYFSSSVNGDRYIGYHINQGADKEAYFVSSAKYYDKLYRPDIIEASLETGSEEKAIKKIAGKRKVSKPDIISEAPPILTLLSRSNYSTGNSSITVKFTLESSSPVKKIIVSRNGEKIPTESSGEGSNKTITIDLDEGENIISIRAKNQYAASDEILLNITREGHRSTAGGYDTKPIQTDLYKPTLYLLSIGVSQYKNSEYNLEVADKDAISIVEIFKKQEGKIYKKVIVKQLINQDASKDNILDALEWVERETTQRDMVIIFVAGHGINDDKGNYYFMAHDSDVDKLRRTALRWIEIKDTLTDLPSKVILMVDTCHSGNIMGQERRRDLTGAIKSIINSGTGSVIMTASTGRGYSIENKSWGHGAFTKAMIEGLGNAQADYNHNKIITIKEIDLYITDRVKELTKGKQKPTTIIPESIPDFALGVK